MGDIGVIGFLDARLSRSVNISVNGGYILKSNPKFANGEVILDVPDEFLAGVGLTSRLTSTSNPFLSCDLRNTLVVAHRMLWKTVRLKDWPA
jgi:hypothetical protein